MKRSQTKTSEKKRIRKKKGKDEKKLTLFLLSQRKTVRRSHRFSDPRWSARETLSKVSRRAEQSKKKDRKKEGKKEKQKRADL